MSKETLKEQIDADITTNGLQQITGAKLNNVLNDIVDEMAIGGGVIEEGNTQAVSGGEVFNSINGISGITPIKLSTPSPEKNGIFQPTEIGVYENFGGLEVTEIELESSIVYFYYLDGVFSKEVKYVLTVDDIESDGVNAVNGKAVFDFTTKKVNTIADLRLLEGVEGQIITLLGYYEAGDKPIVTYYYSSEELEDNGGSVISSAFGSWLLVENQQIDVRHFGAFGKGLPGEGAIIQKILGLGYKIVSFPNKGKIILSEPLLIRNTVGLTLEGNFCNISYPIGTDGVVFDLLGDSVSPNKRVWNINIKNFVSLNTAECQTFINASSTHHLHVSNCITDGTKLFINARDCYFMTVEKNQLFSIKQAFDFRDATNAFNIIGNSIYGAGIPSYFKNNTTGGNISGNSFELSAGALYFDLGNFGLNITGNYFEGYGSAEYYIKFDGGSYTAIKGFNISGNLFYAGASYAIYLQSISGCSITGNRFGTKHAIRQYCFDGRRNNDIMYSGNSWRSQESGASEFDYYGASKDGLIAGDIKTMNRFLPTTNVSVENYDDDALLYNNSGTLMKKSLNKAFIVGGQLRLFYSNTVANQVENLNINLRKLGYLAKIYVFNAAIENKVDEYTLLRSVNNPELMFLKAPSVKEYPQITISLNSTTINMVDTLGGRFINVVMCI